VLVDGGGSLHRFLQNATSLNAFHLISIASFLVFSVLFRPFSFDSTFSFGSLPFRLFTLFCSFTFYSFSFLAFPFCSFPFSIHPFSFLAFSFSPLLVCTFPANPFSLSFKYHFPFSSLPFQSDEINVSQEFILVLIKHPWWRYW
jgi:hypothetical protein